MKKKILAVGAVALLFPLPQKALAQSATTVNGYQRLYTEYFCPLYNKGLGAAYAHRIAKDFAARDFWEAAGVSEVNGPGFRIILSVFEQNVVGLRSNIIQDCKNFPR